MKKFFVNLSVLLLGGWLLSGCDRFGDYTKEQMEIFEPHVIYFGNLTEVIIDPCKEKCRIVYEHYNRKRGDAFHIPYGVATVYFAEKKFVVSDKGTGNLAIKIDGEEYSLRESNPVIRAGQGLYWTKTRFTQGPERPVVWIYPLKSDLAELIGR